MPVHLRGGVAPPRWGSKSHVYAPACRQADLRGGETQISQIVIVLASHSNNILRSSSGREKSYSHTLSENLFVDNVMTLCNTNSNESYYL